MAYEAKTDWQLNDTVMPTDMNRIEQQVLLNSQMGEQIIEQISPEITEISDKIGNTDDTGGSSTEGTLMAKANNNIELSKYIKEIVLINLKAEYPTKIFSTNGSYTVDVPPIVTQAKITACGAGGGGGGDNSSSSAISSGGGGGGAAINATIYNLNGKTSLSITVGKGGAGGNTSSNTGATGAAGGSTIIAGIVTLAGGGGGKSSTTTSYATGGSAGGTGGYDGQSASDGGKGGGNIIGGTGGTGGSSGGYGEYTNGTNGSKGGGGGGGGCPTIVNGKTIGGNGGDGYVKIEWVW